MGLVDAQKSLFALRTALFSLRRYPGKEALEWCRAIYEEVGEKQGLRYAREIGRMDSKTSASGRESLPLKPRQNGGVGMTRG